MCILDLILRYELVIALALLIIVLLLLIWLLLRKLVQVAGITVQTDKDTYMRAETVHITGTLTLDGKPAPNQIVSLEIKPPDPEAEPIELSATTDENGEYAADWSIPSDAEGGMYTLTAYGLGAKAIKTFTLNKSQNIFEDEGGD